MNSDDEAEATLIARLKKRDPLAFEILYTRHAEALYVMAVRILGNENDAADAAHDAWLRGAENLHRFEGRSSFRTWLTGILMNCLRERWREERDVVSIDLVEESASSVPPLTEELDPIDLENAIAALPPRFRRVLVLHDVEGFGHEEIAGMLGIVSGTSKSQLSRARYRLRELLTSGVRRKMT